MLSVSNWRIVRQRLAPSAVRIAISFRRATARTRRRLATLTHAISSTKTTAPASTSSPKRMSPTTFFKQRFDLNAAPRVGVGIDLFETPADRVHLLLRLPERNPRFESRKDAKRIARALRGARSEVQRRRHLGLRGPERREAKLRRHNADHRVGLAVQRDRLPGDIRIAAKTPLPHWIAEHEDAVVAGLQVFGLKRASHERFDAKNLEHPLAKPDAGNGLGPVAARQRSTPSLRGSHPLETPALGAPVQKVRRRGRVPAMVQNRDDAFRLAVSEGLEQHAANDAENRSVRPNAERQRQHRDRGEARASGQHPQTVTSVLNDGPHHSSLLVSEKRFVILRVFVSS